MLSPPLGVFVSYSRKDAAWLEELRPHLKSLARKRLMQIEFWDDTAIQPGETWRERLDAALKSARGAILLISKHFLISEFILDHELPDLVAAAKAGRAKLFSVILSPCRFEDLADLSNLQTVNSPSRPLEGMEKAEWEGVFVHLTRVLEKELVDGRAGTGVREEPDRKGPALRPLQDRIIVRKIEEQESSAGGGIVIPDSAKEKPQEGQVIAVGPGDLLELGDVVIAPAGSSGTPQGWDRVVLQRNQDGSLRFSAIAQGIAMEATIDPGSILKAEELMQQAAQSLAVSQSTGRALFQLLIPASFQQAFRGAGTVVVLDDETEWLPLESMFAGQRPIAVDTPIIRQHRTSLFAPLRAAQTRRVLVVGDPRTSGNFPPLAGARQEANIVAEKLETSGREVVRSISESAVDVLTKLFGDEWQILHFAGPGVKDLVLSENVLFTPAEVSQLAAVPELVFLNAEHAADLTARFAAIGSRAVIAPASHISDEGAVTFATEFYAAMTSGEPFWRAVLSARRKTYDSDSTTGTWAAYRCYGDPEFVLAGGEFELRENES